MNEPIKLIACANNSTVEEYLRMLNELGRVDLCEVVHDYDDLLLSVGSNDPNVLFIINRRSNEELADFIQSLREIYNPEIRVIVFYGSDNEEREAFVNFLIGKGIYDFFIGKRFDKDIVDNLLFNPQTKEQVLASVPNYQEVSTYHTEIESDSEAVQEAPVEPSEQPSEEENAPAPQKEEEAPINVLEDMYKSMQGKEEVQAPIEQKTKPVKPVEAPKPVFKKNSPAPIKKVKQDRGQDDFEFVRNFVDKLSFEEKKKLGLVSVVSNVEDRILGTVTIAVAGASPKVGCTVTAINLAYFLSRHEKNFRVAVVQLNEKKDFQELCSFGMGDMLSETSFRCKKVDFYFDTPYSEVKKKDDYNYIVLDLGQLKRSEGKNNIVKNSHYDMMHWANQSILVCNSMPWNHEDLTVSLFDQDGNPESKEWKLLFNLADNDFFGYLESEIGNQWDMFKCPSCQGIFKTSPEYDYVLSEVVQKALPKRNKEVLNKEKHSTAGSFPNPLKQLRELIRSKL